MQKIVAIDGPCASGKGTVAKLIKEKCNLTYIDTGAMYRAIAYLTIVNSINIDDEEKIVDLAKDSKIEFKQDKVFINDMDVTNEIRTLEVSKIVSPISSIVKLREVLVDKQRELANGLDVIMEGRDITTVVFPDATYKFYLDADFDERAKRRYKECLSKGMNVSIEEVKENMRNRDYNDSHKEVGSLIRTEDAIYIDSTNMSVEEVVNKIVNIIEGEK